MSGATIELRKIIRAGTEEKVATKTRITTLGPVTPDSIARLMDHYREIGLTCGREGEEALTKLAAAPRIGPDAVAHYIKIIESQMSQERAMVAQDLLAKGEYLTYIGTWPKALFPASDFFYSNTLGGATLADGRVVNTFIPMRLADHPQLRYLVEEHRQLTQQHSDELAHEFNSKPYEERVRLVEREDSAFARMRKLAGLPRSPERDKERRDLQAHLLRGLNVDRRTMTANSSRSP
ncbi:MAG: hypothetical protein H6837_16320 [Planctomycetes bacterium]|nr:hypothetical protein [Planctomycetota bacterium]